jgi:hypothetical protein
MSCKTPGINHDVNTQAQSCLLVPPDSDQVHRVKYVKFAFRSSVENVSLLRPSNLQCTPGRKSVEVDGSGVATSVSVPESCIQVGRIQ